MAIDFPTSPTNGQTLVSGTSTYTWNSTAGTWDLTTSTVVGPTGPTGPSGVIAVTYPITNSGTSTSATLGYDQSNQFPQIFLMMGA